MPYSSKHDDALDALCRLADLETGVMLVKPDGGRRARPKPKSGQLDVYGIDAPFVPY